MRLNIGCGYDTREGWINIDIRDGPGVDMLGDLETGIPLGDSVAREILLDNVLEHLHEPYRALLECWRLLLPGGTLTVRVPHYQSKKAHIVTHRQLFDTNSLDPVIKGRHMSGASPENMGRFNLIHLQTIHQNPFAWHQRKYLGREILAWKGHEIEWILEAIK